MSSAGLPLIEALDLRPTTEPASPDEYVWDWPAPPTASADAGCGRCHGDGVITVGGYSVNPFNGVRGPDPQEAVDATCPDCCGSGGVPIEEKQSRPARPARETARTGSN